MIDTESISFANFGKEFENYHVESFVTSIIVPKDGHNGGAEIVYAQSKVSNQVHWSVQSLD